MENGYEEPVMEVVVFDTEDVITASMPGAPELPDEEL